MWLLLPGDYRSHADERWCRWLHNALETYRVPKRLVGGTTEYGPVPARLTPIFRDRDELTGAIDLSSKDTEFPGGAVSAAPLLRRKT